MEIIFAAAGAAFFVSAWLLMLFARIIGTEVGIRPFGYLTSMVMTIVLWLTLAPAIGAIARTGKEKSSIRHAADATLLGFGFYFDGPQVRIRVAPKAIRRLKGQLRVLTGPRTPASASSTSAIRTYCGMRRCSAR